MTFVLCYVCSNLEFMTDLMVYIAFTYSAVKDTLLRMI